MKFIDVTHLYTTHTPAQHFNARKAFLPQPGWPRPNVRNPQREPVCRTIRLPIRADITKEAA